MKIAREGFLFIFPILVLACLFFALGLWFLVGLSLVIASCFGFFFRDPKRRVPQDENSILSPADGKIVKIQTIPSYPSFPSSVRIISVFLSLLDVHITRSPVSGYIDGVEYHPGKFFAAYNDKASLENESNSIFLHFCKFIPEELFQKVHKGINFSFWSFPVFFRKGIKCEP